MNPLIYWIIGGVLAFLALFPAVIVCCETRSVDIRPTQNFLKPQEFWK